MTDMMIPTWTVGDRLRKARVTAGVSVSEMATELEVDRTTITRWEQSTDVRRLTLLAYAMRCGVPSEWLESGVLPTGRQGGPWAA